MAGLFALLAGCGTPSAPPTPSPAQTAASTASSATVAGNPDRAPAVDSVLRRLAAALRDHDAAGFTALVSERDPGFADNAKMIFTNLGRLSPTVLQLTATGKTEPLSKQRAAVLGSDAYAAEVTVRWQVNGDRSPSDLTVWMTFGTDRSGSGLRWAGNVDGPGGKRPTPLWWLEPIRVDHDQHATVIAGPDVAAADWLERADGAIRDVKAQAASAPDGPWRSWNHRLVLVIPSSEDRLEQMLGVADGAESALAAVTWPDGSRAGRAPIRIMINSGSPQPDLGARIVLTHETVHVATASPTSPAPTWLIEGFADYVAYRSYPRAQQAAAGALLQQVSRSGPPQQLPTDKDFTGSGEELDLAYAKSWLACHYLARTYGTDALFSFYAAVDRSTAGEIGPASRTAFGIDEDQLLTGWRSYLSDAARQGRI
ncbi:MAG TPA: hypothetical protein VIP98_01560 [Microlunatus sp.]